MKKKRLILLILSSVFILFSSSFANSGTQYLFTGGLPASNVQNLHYVLSGGDAGYQALMQSAVNKWNGISSKVNVSLNSSGAKVSVYDGSTPQNGLCGHTFLYYRDFWGHLVIDTYHNNIWEFVDVYGYDNQMNNFYFSTDEKKSVFCHEMGHALSLGHNDSAFYLIMNSNALDNTQVSGPQNDDKANLKLKWGY